MTEISTVRPNKILLRSILKLGSQSGAIKKQAFTVARGKQ